MTAYQNLLLLLASSSGGGASVVTNGAIVANRLQIPTSSQSGTVNFTCQRQHTATTQGAISTLVCTDIHWTMSTSSFTLNAVTGTYTFKKFIEYPQGTFTPVLYAGTAIATLTTGTLTVTSDTLAINIPAGATFWEHTINLAGSNAAHIELPATASVIGALDAKYASGGTPSHQSSPQASTFMFGSVLMTGTVTGPAAAQSVVLYGDSILWGAGDLTAVGAKQSSGPWGRCLDNAGIGHFRFGVSSMKAQDMASLIAASSPTYAPLQTLLNAAATHAIIEFGANDLSLGSRTQAQLLADYVTIQAALPAPKWGLATITPRTSSTDSYATTANQTVKVDGTWPLLTSVNNAIRGLPGGAQFVVEYADDVMTARDSGIWKVPGFQPTTDGTHPTSLMADYLATNLTITLP